MTSGIDSKWRLVTGQPQVIYDLSKTGFFSDLLDGRRAGTHTEKAFLLDGQRRIRGIYNATQPADMRRLKEDIQLLSAAPDTGAAARTGM